MNDNDYTPKEEIFTIIYDRNGKEITRLAGTVFVYGKEWDNMLPVRVDYVKVTTQLVSRSNIEKGTDNEPSGI